MPPNAKSTLAGPRIAALAASPVLLSLEDLYLGDNAIGSAGAKALAESPHLDGLACLSLGEAAGLSPDDRERLHQRFGKRLDIR